MCNNIKLFVAEMSKHKINCRNIVHERWGNLVYLTLPGGVKLGVYESKHASPESIKTKSKPNVKAKGKLKKNVKPIKEAAKKK